MNEETIIKGLMVHYVLPNWAGNTYNGYVKTVTEEHPEFKHLFYPSSTKEGVEILMYPDKKTTKTVL